MNNAGNQLGIRELATLCVGERAANLDLAAELGKWVPDVPAGRSQRLYASACRRHAWHANLWAERSPAIPGVDFDAAVSSSREQRLPEQPDEAGYRTLVIERLASLSEIAKQIDSDLDPATTRLLTIVRHDLLDLLNV